MGIGFVVIIGLLAGLLGMFARQALANIDTEEGKSSYETENQERFVDRNDRELHVM